MVELIIEETGFPKNRETLKEFQDSFRIPIQELLSHLPGRRVFSGFETSAPGLMQHVPGGASVCTKGIVSFNGKLWTVEAYNGTIQTEISFFEEVIDMSFNVNTQADPIYLDRPGKIRRYGILGVHSGAIGRARIDSFVRGRKQLEYLKTGSVHVGRIVVDGSTAIYHVDFRGSIGTSDYQVIGNFRAADRSESFTKAFTWDINNRKTTGFDIFIDQATANSIPLTFDYTIIPINRITAIRQEL